MISSIGIVRRKHTLEGLRYASDVTDTKWVLLKPSISLESPECGDTAKDWGHSSQAPPYVKRRTAR